MPNNWKPIYKADYSVQGALINEKIPNRIDEMFAYVMQLSYGSKDAIRPCIAWLTAMMPPFKRFFTNYETLLKLLEECEKEREKWISENQAKGFPVVLREKIIQLYTAWWEAYNDSGAGIRGTVYDPQRGSKLYGSLTGKRTS